MIIQRVALKSMGVVLVIVYTNLLALYETLGTPEIDRGPADLAMIKGIERK